MHAARLTAVAILFAAGCDELGNPVGLGGPTPPAVWESPIASLTTRAETVPAERAEELVARVPPEQLFHIGRPTPGGYATLVSVAPRWTRQLATPVVPLITELQLRDGTVMRTAWTAEVRAPTWYALLAPRSPPVAAATAFAR